MTDSMEYWILRIVTGIVVSVIAAWITKIRGKKAIIISGTAIITFVVVFLFFLLLSPRLSDEAKFLYGDYLDDKYPIAIYASSPPVYKFVNKGDKAFIDKNSTKIKTVSIQGDILPEVVRSATQYTGIGEAKTLYNLGILLKGILPRKDIKVCQSRLFTDEHPMHAIVLGGWVSSVVSEQYVASKPYSEFEKKIPFRLHDGFLYEYDTTTGNVTEVHANTYKVVDMKSKNTNGREIVQNEIVPVGEWAIITKVKHPQDNTTLLIVAGINSQGTEMAGNFVSRPQDMLTLFNRVRGSYSEIPRWFQVVLKIPVKVNGCPGEMKAEQIFTVRKLDL